MVVIKGWTVNLTSQNVGYTFKTLMDSVKMYVLCIKATSHPGMKDAVWPNTPISSDYCLSCCFWFTSCAWVLKWLSFRALSELQLLALVFSIPPVLPFETPSNLCKAFHFICKALFLKSCTGTPDFFSLTSRTNFLCSWNRTMLYLLVTNSKQNASQKHNKTK